MAKSFFSSIIFLLMCPFTISCWVIYPERCNPGFIRIYQWPSQFGSLNVPKYTVQIINEAWHVEGIHDVQLSCPGFASTTLINPNVFRRINSGNCLLEAGRTISPGQVITFEYSNILPFNLSVTSLQCS